MSYTQVFGGTTIYPSDVSLLALALTADKALEWPLESNDPANPAARIIDVTTSGAYSITLPDATQTGAGQTILFNNLPASTNAFTVKDHAGGTLATIAVGEQWQLYLANTSTAAGTWRVFRYGASTATVQPSALAGYGLTVTSNQLSQSQPVVTFNSSPRTVLLTDRASAFVWNGTGTGTLNLPAAAVAGNNFFIAVRNSGGGDLTVDPAGSETIDGGSVLALRPGDSTSLITDGLAWYTLGLGQEAVFAFDYTAVTVTGGTYTLTGSELNRIAYKFVGTLTADQYVVVPSTVQQYWVDNATTGPYNFFLQTSGGTPASVTQGARGIYYCNGSQVIDADTATVSLPISATDGGTGITSYAVGDLIYANSASTLAKLSDVAVGNVLLSGGVGVAPAWGKVDMAVHITGVLGVANGGTGAGTLTGVIIGNGTSAFTTKTNPVGAFVGTTDAQTLTNKTIALADNTVNYTPQGSNTVTRTVQAKLHDTISVSDYTSLANAITAAKVSGRPTVILVNGDINVAATIVVDAANITLQGAGADSSHDVGSQGANARAKLIWVGAAGGTVLQFASPTGAGNQTLGGGGANNLYIACGASAAIGLQVLSWRKGTFENIHIDNPTTVGVDVGVVATLGEARDTQNCYFRNISSRHFEVAGGTGGLLRLGGDATANTSLNMFEQLDCAFVNGTAYLFNNCDNNYFIRTRAFRGGGGTGSAVVFNGSNVSAAEAARSNIFTHFTSNGPLPIICRGTSSFTYPSIDNNILLLDYDNGYTPPTIETGSSATWSDTRGLQAKFGYIGVPAGDDISNTTAAETRLGSSTVHVVNGAENHIRLSDPAGTNEWGVSLASGDFRIVRAAGSGNFLIPANTNIPAGATVTDTGGVSATSPGFRGLPINSKTASYTLALTDAGRCISITTGGVVIPANASIAFPVGSAVVVYNDSASTQTISITTDTLRQAGTTNTGSRTLAAYGVATLTKVAATTWVASGNLT